MEEEDEGFLLRSQLSKLQLAVQSLSKENSRLKLENELLLKHALPPPPCPSPPPLPYHHPCHQELMPPGHLDLPSPPRPPASTQHALPPPTFEMQSALEEVRMLQQRLELLKGKLREEEEEQRPPLRRPQCYPPSPQPGGSTDFFDLVEQLNGHQSPHRPQRSRPQHSSPPRPGWRSPNALPRSPPVHHRATTHFPTQGTSPYGQGRQYSPSAKGAPRRTAKGGAQKMQSPSRIPFSNISNGRGSASGGRKSARMKSHQSAVNARLHYGIPSKQW